MAITPLPALDRTSPTFKTDVDAFFGSQIPTFSVETEAARVEINANKLAAQGAATTATQKADLTSADAIATAADRVATGLDKTATAADRAQTGLDRVATGLDRTATAADRAQTGLDRAATAALVDSISDGPVTSVGGETGVVTLKTLNGSPLTGSGNIVIDSSLYRVSRTSNTQLGATDKGRLIDITSGTFTQTFAAAAALGDGWYCYIKNSGAGIITLDPSGSETFDGAVTRALHAGQSIIVQCDGSSLRSVPLVGVGDHHVTVSNGNGHGTANTKIRRFTTTQSASGTDVVYADSAAAGASFTINGPGIYSILYQDESQNGQSQAISLNSTQLTVDSYSIAASSRLAMWSTTGNASASPISVVTRLSPGDVVRPHTSGTQSGTTAAVMFSIRKVGV